MSLSTYAHFMDLVSDQGNPEQNVLRKFGYHYQSEVFDESSGNWSFGVEFETRVCNDIFCLFFKRTEYYNFYTLLCLETLD